MYPHTETPSQSPTESPTQSATESPTESATESPTQSATESPTQSATESPTQSATESPTQSATESPTPIPDQTPIRYDAGIISNKATGKDNVMTFDCPVQDGSVKIYATCTSCNQIQPTDKVWFIVYFSEGNIERIEHQDIAIHGSTKMSAFAPSDRISYDQNTNALSYYLDSQNMFYSSADIDLKCDVIPMTAMATPTESPTQSPTEPPSKTPSEKPPDEIIIIDQEEVGEDKRVDKPNPDTSDSLEKVPTIEINVTNFTDIKYDGEFGGAIHIVN